MSLTNSSGSGSGGGSSLPAQPTRSQKIIFWASFFTLIAAGMGFSLRNTSVKDQWGAQYGFSRTELGEISGGGLAGFGITIIVLSFIADKVGFARLMGLAFFFHVSSAIVTLLATPMYKQFGRDGAYYCLSIGMWLFAFGNGTCEAVINPLTATLFPHKKTHWLNILHAGWPGGLVLGSLTNMGLDNFFGKDLEWEKRLSIFLIPVIIYGLMMFRRAFPPSEAHASGVPMTTMLVQFFSPILLFLMLIHAMVGYVELGTDSWMTSVTNLILNDLDKATILFIWTSTLMFILRFFAGPIVHRISPLGLLFVSAVLGTCGLILFHEAKGIEICFLAATIYGLGKTFFWPTMLGVVSERFPKGGALTLGVVGGIGMLSAGLLGDPGIGYEQDFFAVKKIESLSKETYQRYKVADSDQKGFPFVTNLMTKIDKDNVKLPLIAGLDNSKVGVLMEYQGKKDKSENLSFEIDMKNVEEALKKQQEKDKANPNKNLLEKGELKVGQKNEAKEGHILASLKATKEWWETQGKPHAEEDFPKVTEAKLYGGQKALLWTAIVPATMACCYLLLIIFFKLTGGYTQKYIENTPHH